MRAAPTGTVTFLFTDIEGSTRLWENHPEAMNVALARHDALLAETIEACGGCVFKTVGDAFCCAFASAADALMAAQTVQDALLREAWGVPSGIRVRIALHTGPAEGRDGDYFGPTVNRVARLLSAGHGGQILISQATREALGNKLAPGADLKDMGEHRLKDLTRPERVFQLVYQGLPADFPPLRTLNARLNNLPLQPTPLIGRQEEVRTAVDLLGREDVRVVTMTGAGGSGKTRLALQVAAEAVENFEGGVFFVPLAAITDPALVPSTIAQQIGVRETPGRPIMETLKNRLRETGVLLLLDNFEQIIVAAPEVAGLLEACARLKVLVTSRSPLHIRAEHEFPVAPLSLPDLRALPGALELLQYSAVVLFAERAAAVRPGFAVSTENARAVAEICVRLDGLPLAIELAAARCKVLSPQAMLSRLEHRLSLLTGGPRDLPERQQTLRSTIDWSYGLLDEEEKKLFRLLSVFVGGFSVEAADAVCEGSDALSIAVLKGLASLVDMSLLRQEEREQGEPRFYMLETVREYGLDALAESSEEGPVCKSHALFFIALAEEAEPRLEEEDQALWLERLEREHDNLRAALDWLTASGDVGRALDLASSLCLFWFMRGYLAEGRQRMSELLALPSGQEQTAQRARALDRAAFLARFLGDYAATSQLIGESVAIFRRLGDRKGVADSLSNLGDAALYHGDLEETEALHTESLEISRELGNRQGIADSLSHLGMSAYFRNDLARAETMHEESLAIWKELGDRQGVAWALHKLGAVRSRREDLDGAQSLLCESLGICRELDYSFGVAWALEALVAVELKLGRVKQAVRLAGAADAVREEVGAPTPALWEAELRHTLDLARGALGPDVYDRAWTLGRGMKPEDAIAYALGE